MGPFDSVAEELFRRQVKYKEGRHWIDVPFQEAERMHWIGSTNMAFLEYFLRQKMGNDYFVEAYKASKLYGTIFGSRITTLVKTPRLIATMLTLIVKQFGWGRIETEKTEYKDDWLSFKFYDLPDAREIRKFFGKQEFPVDYAVAGLISGCAEQLLKRKFITVESKCIASGDPACYFETLSLKNFEAFLSKVSNQKQKDVLVKILELEKATDFLLETERLRNGKEKEAVLAEKDYLNKFGLK